MSLHQSPEIVVSAEDRSLSGYKLRTQGLIPGVIYHNGKSRAIAIDPKNLPAGHSHSTPIKVKVGADEMVVLMREVQVNPLTGRAIHFDFQQVSEQDIVRVKVPMQYTGITSKQEKEGRLDVKMRYLPLRCPVKKLPSQLTVDISELAIGSSIWSDSLKLDPEMRILAGQGKKVVLASLAKR